MAVTSTLGPCSIVVLDSPPPPDSIMVGLTDDLPILLDTGLDRPSLSLLSCLGRDLESPKETAQRGTWSFCSQNKPLKYDWINQNCLPGMNKVLIENLHIWTKNLNLIWISSNSKHLNQSALRSQADPDVSHHALRSESSERAEDCESVHCVMWHVSIKTFRDSRFVSFLLTEKVPEFVSEDC